MRKQIRSREYYRERNRRYAKERREYWLRRNYGITAEDFDRMFSEQSGRCGICCTEDPGGRTNTFHVDHCHETGRVRGLLCNRCNRALGQFNDSEELLLAAIAYLTREEV